jgi:hypothetical protein
MTARSRTIYPHPQVPGAWLDAEGHVYVDVLPSAVVTEPMPSTITDEDGVTHAAWLPAIARKLGLA